MAIFHEVRILLNSSLIVTNCYSIGYNGAITCIVHYLKGVLTSSKRRHARSHTFWCSTVHCTFNQLIYKRMKLEALKAQHLDCKDSMSVCIKYVCVYRVFHEECVRLREGIPYVKLYRYNPKHLCPKLNGYGDNGQRSLKL